MKALPTVHHISQQGFSDLVSKSLIKFYLISIIPNPYSCSLICNNGTVCCFYHLWYLNLTALCFKIRGIWKRFCMSSTCRELGEWETPLERGTEKITVSKWGFRDLEAEVRKGCSQAGVSGQTDPHKKTQEQEEYYGSVTPWDTLNTSWDIMG